MSQDSKKKQNPQSSGMSKKTRRQVLRSLVVGTAAVGAALLGFIPVVRQWQKRLRPPGALIEEKFLAACIKCGQCVQVCPVEAVVLADAEDGFGFGTPYIDARTQACDFSCDALQCILACPTGALNPEGLDKKEQVRMGLAKFISPETCLAMKGEGFKGTARGDDFPGLHRYMEVDRWNPIRIADHPYDLEICDLCQRECPIEGAILFEPVSDDPEDKRRKPVVQPSCVGCGMCEMICPVEESCIVIEPNSQGGVAV